MLRRACELAVRAEPALLLLLIPAIPVPQKLLYLALLGVPVVWACARLARGHYVSRSPLDWAMVLLLAMIGTSQAVSGQPVYSLPKTTFLIWGVATFYVLNRCLTTRRVLGLAGVLFLLLGQWINVLGLFASERIVTKVPLLSYLDNQIPDFITPLWGFILSPLSAAGAIIFFIPLQVTWLAASLLEWRRTPRFPAGGRWWGWALQLLGLLVSMAMLLLSQTRGAWLGLVVGFVGLGAWRLAAVRPRLAQGLMAACLAVAIIGPQALAAWQAAHAGSGGEPESTIERQAIWADTFRAIHDFPLTGLGIVSMREALPMLYPVETISPYTLGRKEPHSQLLEAAVWMGLPALVAYLALWLGAAHMLLRAQRVARDAWLRALVRGLAAGLLANFIYGVTDSVFVNGKVGIAFWLALGLAAAAYRLAIESGRDEVPAGRVA